ncbi:MAG: branched-chain amino acid ABC transporter permease [Firmicutes bacterium]|nr:branched-chain amino acid ABC transporter permease [Bacillota bacterium]
MLVSIFLSALAVGCIYSLIAIGFSLIYRASGILDFSQGEMTMLGALLGWSLVSRASFPYLAAMAGVMVLVGVLSVLKQRIAYQPIRTRSNSPVLIIISSIGLLMILNQTAVLLWGAEPLQYPAQIAEGGRRLGGVWFPMQTLWIIGIAAVLMLVFHLVFHRTQFGRMMRAVADDPLMSRLVGINVNHSVGVTFLVAGALAAAAGALYAPIYYASYEIGIIGVKGFAAAILGGYGNIVGAMIGGIILGQVEAFGSTYISSAYRDVLAYTLLILVLLLRPQGILGERRRSDA